MLCLFFLALITELISKFLMAESKDIDFFRPPGMTETGHYLHEYSFEMAPSKEEMGFFLGEEPRVRGLLGLTSVELQREGRRFPVKLDGVPFGDLKVSAAAGAISRHERGLPTYRIGYRERLHVQIDTLLPRDQFEKASTEEEVRRLEQENDERFRGVYLGIQPMDKLLVKGNVLYQLVREGEEAAWMRVFSNGYDALFPMPPFMDGGKPREVPGSVTPAV